MRQKDEHKHHEELINGIYEQLRPVMENSEQAMYIYLDDNHAVFNKKFATLLGYKSVDELLKVKGTFLDAFVDSKSQNTKVNAFRKAMEKMAGSTISINWKKKSGGLVKTAVILVPISYHGHLFALHFLY